MRGRDAVATSACRLPPCGRDKRMRSACMRSRQARAVSSMSLRAGGEAIPSIKRAMRCTLVPALQESQGASATGREAGRKTGRGDSKAVRPNHHGWACPGHLHTPLRSECKRPDRWCVDGRDEPRHGDCSLRFYGRAMEQGSSIHRTLQGSSVGSACATARLWPCPSRICHKYQLRPS